MICRCDSKPARVFISATSQYGTRIIKNLLKEKWKCIWNTKKKNQLKEKKKQLKGWGKDFETLAKKKFSLHQDKMSWPDLSLFLRSVHCELSVPHVVQDSCRAGPGLFTSWTQNVWFLRAEPHTKAIHLFHAAIIFSCLCVELSVMVQGVH